MSCHLRMSILIDTILADVCAAASHYPPSRWVSIDLAALRKILDRLLLAEALPPCRCGSPSVTIIGEVAMCGPCADKWQGAAARWQSPVEPQLSPEWHASIVPFTARCGADYPGIRTTTIAANVTCENCISLMDADPARKSFNMLFAAMSPDAQGRAENRASGMASALDFMNARPGETWVVTMACKEHKGIVAEGKPFARQFGDVHPCQSGCLYKRVSDAAPPPVEPPRIRSDDVTGTDPQARLMVCAANRNAFARYMPDGCASPLLHVRSEADVPSVCGRDLGTKRACRHHIEKLVPLDGDCVILLIAANGGDR